MRDLAARALLQLSRACAVLVLLAMLAPLVYAVWMSFAPGELLELPTREWSLRWYREFLDSPRWALSLRTTGEVSLLSVAMSVVAGLGLAVAVTRFRFRGERVL